MDIDAAEDAVRLILGELEQVLPELTEEHSPLVRHRLHQQALLIATHNVPPAEASSQRVNTPTERGDATPAGPVRGDR
ncbi:hypothetical protein ACFYNO_26370 [Kitasatospora sp. NPDC006697]|uniref:hypothetical protein n=1 Tax=Kitasatospora sp. NPDC006697 TaxID=3364020 RepID=UPI0036D1A281